LLSLYHCICPTSITFSCIGVQYWWIGLIIPLLAGLRAGAPGLAMAFRTDYGKSVGLMLAKNDCMYTVEVLIMHSFFAASYLIFSFVL
jgi:hypothetical protein